MPRRPSVSYDLQYPSFLKSSVFLSLADFRLQRFVKGRDDESVPCPDGLKFVGGFCGGLRQLGKKKSSECKVETCNSVTACALRDWKISAVTTAILVWLCSCVISSGLHLWHQRSVHFFPGTVIANLVKPCRHEACVVHIGVLKYSCLFFFFNSCHSLYALHGEFRQGMHLSNLEHFAKAWLCQAIQCVVPEVRLVFRCHLGQNLVRQVFLGPAFASNSPQCRLNNVNSCKMLVLLTGVEILADVGKAFLPLIHWFQCTGWLAFVGKRVRCWTGHMPTLSCRGTIFPFKLYSSLLLFVMLLCSVVVWWALLPLKTIDYKGALSFFCYLLTFSVYYCWWQSCGADDIWKQNSIIDNVRRCTLPVLRHIYLDNCSWKAHKWCDTWCDSARPTEEFDDERDRWKRRYFLCVFYVFVLFSQDIWERASRADRYW